MGDSARNSKRIAEMELIDSSITNFSKKMKLDFGSQQSGLPSLSFKLQPHHCGTVSPEDFVSPATSSNSGGALTGDSFSGESPLSCCSSNDSSEVVKDSLSFSDLEAKSFETEHSTCINNKFSRETSPSSEFYGDTDDMDSPAQPENKENSRRRQSPAEKMPSQSEIDEFFAVTEKEEQKRFAEKYNYDVVKDMPMEGRYQWIRLKP